jgi:hypothetical protein
LEVIWITGAGLNIADSFEGNCIMLILNNLYNPGITFLSSFPSTFSKGEKKVAAKAEERL